MREEQPLLQVGTNSYDEGRRPLRSLSTTLLQPKLCCLWVFVAASLAGYFVYNATVSGTPNDAFMANLVPEDLMDKSANPCEDFYQYACGSFSSLPLPKDHDEWLYAFDGVKERIAQQMKQSLQAYDGQAGVLFRSCQDVDSINAAGVQPIVPYLQIADSVKTNASLVDSVVELSKINAKAFFFWDVGPDADSLQDVLYMEQGGLTLPDRSYYLDLDKRDKVQSLHSFIERTMALTGLASEASKSAADHVVAIETDIARMHLSPAEERAANSLPPLTVAQVIAGMGDAGGFDWQAWFNAMLEHVPASGDVRVRVIDVDFFQRLCQYFTVKSAASLRWYIRWQFMDALIGHLGDDFQSEDLVFRRSLFGVKRDPPRWRICLHTLNLFVPDTLGEVYLGELHQAGAQHRVRRILATLRTHFAAILTDSDWMSPASRAVALTKLDQMLFRVGGPRSVPSLPFTPSPTAWFSNSVLIARQLVKRQLSKLGTVGAAGAWGRQLGPMSVNAWYNVHSNALFVPAAILQPPFYRAGNAGRPGPEDYGGLGGLMGHEMSHGFDNIGRLFGPGRVIKNWWDPATVRGFKIRSNCLGRYYASFPAVGGGHVDANKTLGEDIADTGYLSIPPRPPLAPRMGSWMGMVRVVCGVV